MEPAKLVNSCAAKSIDAGNRKSIALTAIKSEKTITDVAHENNVSRKFIHNQKDKALEAVNQIFKAEPKPNEEVLFYLPVTKVWLRQLILCLLLHCRSSFRGITKVLEDCFDYQVSIGTIHNISNEAKQKAKDVNKQQDLSNVSLGANDELYHLSKPVLAGIDIPSLYCYLLSSEQHCDEATWAIHLWDLEQQGFNPERIFADDGSGLRAGHKLAVPKTPLNYDHFHVINDLTEMRRFFRNRLKSSITYAFDLELKIEKTSNEKKKSEHLIALALAASHHQEMKSLSESIDILVNWMQHDVLNKAGPSPQERYELYDFIVTELCKLAERHPHRIDSVCTKLKKQRHLLLAFSIVLDEKFKIIAQQFDCTLETLWSICKLQRCKEGGDNYAVKLIQFIINLGDQLFYDIEDAVIAAMECTERTSSMVENLNSRLRPYLFLRREIGNDYLELLQFYLNHTPFLRSENNRAKKTPTELLTQKSHRHWLEMLGFERFKRAA